MQGAGGGDTGWPDLVSAIPAGSPTSLPAYRGGRSHRWVFVFRVWGSQEKGSESGGPESHSVAPSPLLSSSYSPRPRS